MRYMLLSAVAVMTLSLGSANSFAQVQNAADASQSSQNQETSQSQGQGSVVVFGEAENSDGTTEAVLRNGPDNSWNRRGGRASFSFSIWTISSGSTTERGTLWETGCWSSLPIV